MNSIEAKYYEKLGVRKEFPKLNPISAALMKAGTALHARKHHVVLEGYPIPTEGAAILTGNHYSSKDALIAGHASIFMAKRFIRPVVKKSLIVRGAYESQEYLESIGDHSERADYNPLEAFIMRGIGVIPIKRDEPESNIAMFRSAYQVLDSGQLLGMFLQASRDEDNLLRNLQKGAAHIASRPKYRNIPIHMIAFEPNKATFLEPVTYNQLKDGYGYDIEVPELTVIFAGRIATALSPRVQDDWQSRQELELKRLVELKST